MTHASDARETPDPAGSAERLPYAGQVTYVFAYDVAYETVRRPIAELMGQKPAEFRLSASRRMPKEVFFYCPQMVRLPGVERAGPRGPVQVRRTVKLFPVGAVSIAVHVPFAAPQIEDLAAYREPSLDGRPLRDEARELAAEVARQLGPILVRPVAPLRDEDAYTVFCLDAAALGRPERPFVAEAWLRDNRRAVAGLLAHEDAELLAEQEVEDTVSHHLSYHRHDLVVVDWYAALVVDDAENHDEALHLVELANVQLTELKTYDRILDEALERAYRDMARRPSARTRAIVHDLREIRLDMSRLSDELSNAAKFFGDWHLARLYQRLFEVFHLGDWHRIIDEKVHALDDLYQLLRQDRINQWMVILEATIVLLFIIDLVVLVVGLAR